VTEIYSLIARRLVFKEKAETRQFSLIVILVPEPAYLGIEHQALRLCLSLPVQGLAGPLAQDFLGPAHRPKLVLNRIGARLPKTGRLVVRRYLLDDRRQYLQRRIHDLIFQVILVVDLEILRHDLLR